VSALNGVIERGRAVPTRDLLANCQLPMLNRFLPAKSPASEDWSPAFRLSFYAEAYMYAV